MEATRDADRKALPDVAETLFVPLSCRALETKSENPIVRDPKAIEIFERVVVRSAHPMPIEKTDSHVPPSSSMTLRVT